MQCHLELNDLVNGTAQFEPLGPSQAFGATSDTCIKMFRVHPKQFNHTLRL